VPMTLPNPVTGLMSPYPTCYAKEDWKLKTF
jgi:hypothetical protein